MTLAELRRIAIATGGTYRPPTLDNDRPDDCTFGPCADCLRDNCPERVEALRQSPRLTPAERQALLAVCDDLEMED